MKTCSSRRPAAAAWSAACFARFLAKPEAPEFPSLVLAGTATTVSADTHRRLYQHVMCANTTPHMPAHLQARVTANAMPDVALFAWAHGADTKPACQPMDPRHKSTPIITWE